MSYRWIVTLRVIVIVFFLCCIFLFLSTVQHKKNVFHRNILLGAWTQGFFDAQTKTLHPETLVAFEHLIHKHVSIAHYYIGWEALKNKDIVSQFALLHNNGWEPMLNVNPYYFAQCPPSALPLYAAIAKGQCDSFLHNAGKNLRHVTRPFYLLFAWEMNNPQNEWSVSYTGSSASDFVSAWRHIHDVFVEEKALNVKWVFCPNVPEDKTQPYSALYPGNKYVDWVGLDGYNWGTTQPWSHWVRFADIFGGAYRTMTHIAPHKPVMIAEVNSAEEGGSKSEWYTDTFVKQIPYGFPNVDAVVIFNEDRTKQENVNWKVDTSASSLHALSASVNTSFYK